MWLLVPAARPLIAILTLILCLESSSAHASERRWYCESEALDHSEALSRIAWAWSCGINFCFNPHVENWSEEDALATCGYPVFNKMTPVSPLYDEDIDYLVCHRDIDRPTQSAPREDDELSIWLSDLVVMTSCSPTDQWPRNAKVSPSHNP